MIGQYLSNTNESATVSIRQLMAPTEIYKRQIDLQWRRVEDKTLILFSISCLAL